MFWVLIAAQISPPQGVGGVIRAADAPLHLLREDRAQSVRFAITVTPDGKIQSCDVEVSSGNSKLDSYTCKLVSQRAKFGPAVSFDGRATYGVHRQTVTWSLSRPSGSFLRPAELYLTVRTLPSGLKAPVYVDVKFEHDLTRGISNCQATDASTSAAVADIACVQLLRDYKAKPARTAEGKPVSSVQTAVVMLEQD